jgi:hypothetical protein
MIPISNSEDDDGPSHVPIPAPGLPPPLAGEAWASWLVLSSAFLLAGKGQAQHAPPSPEAPMPRRLPLYWLLRISVPKNASPMALAEFFTAPSLLWADGELLILLFTTLF